MPSRCQQLEISWNFKATNLEDANGEGMPKRLKAEFEAQPWKTGLRKSTRIELELSQERVDQLYQQLSQ